MTLLTPTRRKILVFWYQYHRRTNLWPTYRDAELELDISNVTICYHMKILIKAGWTIKEGRQVGLTKAGETQLFEAELISTGQKKKAPVNLLVNKIKKKDK